MPMDFPAFPAVGQEYTVGLVTYVYNGTGWVVKGSSSADYVLKAGDTMTGHLGLPTSPAAAQAVRKDYVDTSDALKVSKTGDVMTGDLEISKAAGARLRLVTDPLSANVILGQRTVGGVNKGRWALWLTDGGAETGSNAGSDFALARYDDAGNVIDFPFRLTRATGLVLVTPATASTSPTTGALTVAGGVGINGDLNVNGNINFKGVPAAPLDALAYNGLQVNGSMEVSQELGVTPRIGIGYVVDVWQQTLIGSMVLSAAQVADAPAGLVNSIKVNVTTAQSSIGTGDYALIMGSIEGYRIARLGCGTANAQPITLGFWSKIHRTGTYTGVIRNNAGLTCPFSFTQNVADTWEYKTITFPACTTGTWDKTNGVGLQVLFALAVGSTRVGTPLVWGTSSPTLLGATGQINGVAATSDTFQITGVIVLPGTQAPTAAQSPLIMRPYDQELVICKRYYEKSYEYGQALGSAVSGGLVDWGTAPVGSTLFGGERFQVEKRTAPTVTYWDQNGAPNKISTGTGGGGATHGVTLAGAISANTNKIRFYHGPAERVMFHWVADTRL